MPCDRTPLDARVSELYEVLRRLARRAVRGKAGQRLLAPTELVHESYLRLARDHEVARLRRTEFLALASTVIRNVLVDQARLLATLKRGGPNRRLTLDGHALAQSEPLDLLGLDEALCKLAELDARQARIVELKFFGGLEIDEIAATLRISPRTVDGEWALAKAWLHRELTRRK